MERGLLGGRWMAYEHSFIIHVLRFVSRGQEHHWVPNRIQLAILEEIQRFVHSGLQRA